MALDAQRADQPFLELKRDLVLAIDPSLYPYVEGSSDTEIFFFLALTLGLETTRPAASSGQ